jgi:hypothetical protein
MVYFGVFLMVNFRVCTLDEPFLVIHWDENPLSRIAIRWNSQKPVQIFFHHHQLTIFIKVLFGNVLSKKLFTYSRGKKGLSLFFDDSFHFVLPLTFAFSFLLRRYFCCWKFSLLCPCLNQHWSSQFLIVGDLCLP